MVVKMFFCGKKWLMWRGGRFYWGMVRKKIYNVVVDTGDELWDNTQA